MAVEQSPTEIIRRDKYVKIMAKFCKIGKFISLAAIGVTHYFPRFKRCIAAGNYPGRG